MQKQIKTLVMVALISLLAVVPVMATSGSIRHVEQSQLATPIVIVNTSFLNIRTGPGGQYPILTTLNGGVELAVIGISADRLWYQVSTSAGVGWVTLEFVIPRGDFTFVPEVEAPPIASAIIPSLVIQPGQGGGGAVVPQVDGGINNLDAARSQTFASIIVPSVDLKTEPSILGENIALLFDSDEIRYPIVGNAFNEGVGWVLLSTPEGTGWVEQPKVRQRLSTQFGTVVRVVVDEIQLNQVVGSNRGNPILRMFDEAYLIDITLDGRVEVQLIDGTTGFLPFDAIEQVSSTGPSSTGGAAAFVSGQGGGGVVVLPQSSGLPVATLDPGVVIVNTTALNVRTGPGSQFSIIGTLGGAQELPVLGVTTDFVWYLVQTPFGSGWIDSQFVVYRGTAGNVPLIGYDQVVAASAPAEVPGFIPPATVPTATTRVIINTSRLNIRNGPGGQFDIVTTLSGGTELNAVGVTPDFEWYLVDTAAGRGWLDSEFVIFRGDAGLLAIIEYQ